MAVTSRAETHSGVYLMILFWESCRTDGGSDVMPSCIHRAVAIVRVMLTQARRHAAAIPPSTIAIKAMTTSTVNLIAKTIRHHRNKREWFGAKSQRWTIAFVFHYQVVSIYSHEPRLFKCRTTGGDVTRGFNAVTSLAQLDQ